MTPRLALLTAAAWLAGCSERIGDYLPASSIARGGFLRDLQALAGSQGQVIALWGFVDHANLYGDVGARRVLQEWWSGAGTSATSWRFNLLARETDGAGRSLQVQVPNGPGRDDLLRAFVADARTRRPTK
jgi:hypothetical protein